MRPPLAGPIDPPPLKIAPYFFFVSPPAAHFSPLEGRQPIEEKRQRYRLVPPFRLAQSGPPLTDGSADIGPVFNRRTVFSPPDTHIESRHAILPTIYAVAVSIVTDLILLRPL